MKSPRRFLKFILFVFFIPVSIGMFAQNNYTRVAAGFNYTKPLLQKSFSTEAWKGVHVRTKFLEAGYMSGHTKNGAGTELFGYNFYVGANFPLRKYSFGKRSYGIKGIMVVPFLAGDVGFLGIGGKHGFQGTFAPGISVQLPYVLVDFRMNTAVTFSNNVPGLFRSKLLLMPTIALQFDALWDVMDPKLSFDAHNEGVNEYVSVEETQTEIITTTTYVPYSFDVYKYDVGPHISVGPRVCYWNLKNGSASHMIGIVQSGRAHGFGYDLIAEKGNVRSKSGYDLKAGRAIGRLSFDLNRSESGYTQFTRLMVGIGLGYSWFQESDASIKADDGQFVNLFISYELGAISFSYELNKAFYGAFEDQKYFAFTYRLPIERLCDRYKELKQSR